MGEGVLANGIVQRQCVALDMARFPGYCAFRYGAILWRERVSLYKLCGVHGVCTVCARARVCVCVRACR
jgi:hypothetical protein